MWQTHSVTNKNSKTFIGNCYRPLRNGKKMGQGTSFWRDPGKVDLTLSKEIGVSLTIDFCCVYRSGKGCGKESV